MSPETPVFEVKKLSKLFYARAGLPWRAPAVTATALDQVTLFMNSGEILGLAGESGSGKSTLAEILARLQSPTQGEVLYRGQNLSTMSHQDRVDFRRQVQMIFQDPYESLNPRHTVLRTVSEGLINSGMRSRPEIASRVEEALEQAGLRPASTYLDTYPHQLSGGQRQRVSIARAMVLKPAVLIADEPVSMLDVSLRAAILKLLRGLRDRMGLTILYISHDLSTMSYLCDRVAILYRGQLKELGPTRQVFASPKDAYTRKLLAAVPSLF